jgi:hypothetical protein
MERYRLDPSSDPLSLSERLGVYVSEVYAGIETTLQAEVARRAYAAIDQSPAMEQKIRDMLELEALATTLVQRVDVEALSREIIARAEAAGAASAAARFQEAMGTAPLVATSQAGVTAAVALSLELRVGLGSMHDRIIRWAPDAYQQIVGVHTPSVLLGATTVVQAQKRIVHDFVQQGITGFVAKDRSRRTIGAYSEMAVRTATMRAWNGTAAERIRGQGGGLVTPIIGRTACTRGCLPWRGTILSLDGTPRGSHEYPHATRRGVTVRVFVSGTLEDAKRAGLHHPNCGCVDVRYFPGLTLPIGTTHDPALAAAQTKLRTLEVGVRDAKRRVITAPDEATAREWRAEVRAWQAEIRRHTAETGVRRRNHREQLHWADGDTGSLGG